MRKYRSSRTKRGGEYTYCKSESNNPETRQSGKSRVGTSSVLKKLIGAGGGRRPQSPQKRAKVLDNILKQLGERKKAARRPCAEPRKVPKPVKWGGETTLNSIKSRAIGQRTERGKTVRKRTNSWRRGKKSRTSRGFLSIASPGV